MTALHDVEPSRPQKYLVRDLCATIGPRVHELMVDGRPRKFTFPVQDYIEIDPAVAVPLIGNDGFEVKTVDGVTLRPLNAGPELVQLRTGQVIADLHELDKAALANRCRAYHGGDKFHPIRSTKNDMIDFLMRAQSAAAGEAVDDEDAELEEDSEFGDV